MNTLLNLTPLEPKVITLCYQYSARPACTSVQSDHAIYCWLNNFKFSIDIRLDIPKNNKGDFQTWKVDYSIKEIVQDNG